MTYARSKLTNRSFRPTVVADSNVNLGFAAISLQLQLAIERACPKELLEQAAVHAFEGTKAIGCRLADIKTSGEIHSILNEAWDVFWKNPSKYHDWEKEKIKQLREKYSS